MSDMVAWLTAILDAHEKVAQAALEPWHRSARRQGTQWPRVGRGNGDEDATLLAFHNAYHNPAVVLRDIAAKRAIIDECVGWSEAGELRPGSTWNDQAAGAECARTMLRLLASAHAGEPGYLEEWRP